MNILMSADWLYPAQAGGPSNAIYWQAKALTRAGHSVQVVATAQDLPPSVPTNRWLDRDCGRVIYTCNPHFYLPINHIRQGWRAMRTADVVHVNSLFYPASVCWVLMARLLGKSCVWSVHGELSPEALAFSPRRKKLLLIVCRFIGKVVTFHATCAAEAVFIRQHFGAQQAVVDVPNRMELPAPVPRQARPYLLFIGRLHPIKALDRLLDALNASAVFRQSAYRLIIAGPDSGTYARWLTERVRQFALTEKVSFVGPVQGVDKERLYADAHVTLLPSHAENFGIVVVESLAQGTPVIASTQTPWSVLAAEGAGHWVANDTYSLRNAIDTYLTMPPDEYRRYRARARKLVRRFDIHKNVSQWEHIYADLPTQRRKNLPNEQNAITFHDVIARQFSRKYTVSPAFRERFRVWTSLLDRYVAPTDRVLDLGCGSGVFSRYLADKGCTVTGIDGSAEMIRLCRAGNRSPAARYVVQTLPMASCEEYDPQHVVVASSLLEYIDDVPALIRQVRDLLRPGGLLILSIPNRQSLYRRLERRVFALTGRPRYVAHSRHHTTALALTDSLYQLGFSTREIIYFSGRDPLSRGLAGLLPTPYVNNLLLGVFQKRS